MKVIPINKVIREIEGNFTLDYIGSGIFKEANHIHYNNGLKKAIQIIKDNIKEVDDNDKYDKIAERMLDKFLSGSITSHITKVKEK